MIRKPKQKQQRTEKKMQTNRPVRRHSIRMKITLCLMAIITFMILLSGILSVAFIKRYYYSKLKKDLVATYEACNAFFTDEANQDSSGAYDRDAMEQALFESDSDATIYVVDDVNMQIYTTVNENTSVFNSLKKIGDFLMFSDNIQAQNDQIEREDEEIYDNYKIQITKDKEAVQSYFDLMGFLDNGFVVIIRTTVARVDSTIQATIEYFMTILILTAVISCILMYFFSEIFASPIKRLTKVAKRMATLDFDARIEHPSNDEIGELSCYMNELSYKLNEKGDYIKTIWGMGYKFEVNDDKKAETETAAN